jgi:adenylate cyclase
MRVPLKERARAQAAIESYMSPKVYQLIQKQELEIGGVRREITVFKTDIRDFTNLSEKMDSVALVDFLNRYLERMVEPIANHDGEVDKYMGDAILAKFGATESYPDHAQRAVLAMIEMIEACDRLNEELARDGLPMIRMGIGCNTGEAVVGNIGSAQRMEYTIISDAVNTAQRIEDLCKEVGWDLLISDQTYEQARDVVEVGDPWTIRLRGKTQDTLVYPILGRKGAVPPARRRSYEALVVTRPRVGGSSL